MADLWKNGDVITAEKLNRIVFANMTRQVQSDGSQTYQTDITPADMLDENNIPIGWIIFVETYYEESFAETYYYVVSDVRYEDGGYIIDVAQIGSPIHTKLSAASKTDFFTASAGGTK